MAREFDYIVVGQGLAGSALAIQLLKKGKSIMVLDQISKTSSSRVAAGLFNPVTGKRVLKTWMADELFPYLHDFYTDAENLTKSSFFHTTPIYRPFFSISEQNEWMAKSADPLFAPYISQIFTCATFSHVKDPFGGLLLRQCGYLDTVPYLNAIKNWITLNGTYIEETFDDEELKLEEQGVSYKNNKAKNIIFCQGIQTNKWFNWLSVIPLKGESLKIGNAPQQNVIINRGVYIIPGEGSEGRVGATYDFNDHTAGVTDKGRRTLVEKVSELVNYDFEISSQQWGFRPTTSDRRPIVGRHPEFQNMFILNGLGTKGVSLAPYFSEVLLNYIEKGMPLNEEIDIERYKLLYWTSLDRI